jgi:hypothetical protein
MPTDFMASGPPAGARTPVVVPEVLGSLEDAERSGAGPTFRHAGCTVGPGCGCLGLPLAVLAGVALSSVLALAWVLKALRLVVALPRIAGGFARRGGRRPGSG